MVDMDSINHNKTGATMEFDRTLVQLMVGEINVINEVRSNSIIAPVFL